MHIPTHILSGWLIGQCAQTTKRQRLWCMLSASAADLDGLGILFSEASYVAYHHILFHNALFACALTVIAYVLFHKQRMIWLTLMCTHVHLLLDLLGSGKHWGIAYLYPFHQAKLSCPWGWELNSWQNYTCLGLMLLALIPICLKKKQTPFECIVPSLDQSMFKNQAD